MNACTTSFGGCFIRNAISSKKLLFRPTVAFHANKKKIHAIRTILFAENKCTDIWDWKYFAANKIFYQTIAIQRDKKKREQMQADSISKVNAFSKSFQKKKNML